MCGIKGKIKGRSVFIQSFLILKMKCLSQWNRKKEKKIPNPRLFPFGNIDADVQPTQVEISTSFAFPLEP